ncbi:MAG: hypothetical protein ACKVUS_10620 [Saprospiraceae bacterium]
MLREAIEDPHAIARLTQPWHAIKFLVAISFSTGPPCHWLGDPVFGGNKGHQRTTGNDVLLVGYGGRNLNSGRKGWYGIFFGEGLTTENVLNAGLGTLGLTGLLPALKGLRGGVNGIDDAADGASDANRALNGAGDGVPQVPNAKTLNRSLESIGTASKSIPGALTHDQQIDLINNIEKQLGIKIEVTYNSRHNYFDMDTKKLHLAIAEGENIGRGTFFEELQHAIDDVNNRNPATAYPADSIENAIFHRQVFDRMVKNPLFDITETEAEDLLLNITFEILIRGDH